MRNIIEIKNLKKHFKGVKAVDDVSFQVREGELFAFLGLNGAGKSTTINIICSSLKKDSGQVIIDGLNIDEYLDKVKPLIGVVFQQSHLDGRLSAYDNLRYRASLYGIPKKQFEERINYLSEKLKFNDYIRQPLNKLSGGQRRRIDVARALIHEPKILILDEPTTGLDPNTRILMWNLITELRVKNKLTVLLTTHYMEEASDANYVVILNKGNVVANGTPVKLKNQYTNDYIRIYDYDKNIIDEISRQGLQSRVDGKILIVYVKNANEAVDFIVRNKSQLYDFEIIKGKMDNVFLNVTGAMMGEQ